MSSTDIRAAADSSKVDCVSGSVTAMARSRAWVGSMRVLTDVRVDRSPGRRIATGDADSAALAVTVGQQIELSNFVARSLR